MSIQSARKRSELFKKCPSLHALVTKRYDLAKQAEDLYCIAPSAYTFRNLAYAREEEYRLSRLVDRVIG